MDMRTIESGWKSAVDEADIGNDPCRHRTHDDDRETICEHFYKCSSEGMSCKAFSDYVIRGWFLASDRQPTRFKFWELMELDRSRGKPCTKCDEIKPLSEYNQCHRQGLTAICKTCNAARLRDYLSREKCRTGAK